MTVNRRATLYASALLFALAGCTTTRVVTMQCLTPAQVQQLRDAMPPHIRDSLTGDAQRDLRIIAGSAVRLRGYSEELLGVLETCAKA